MPAVIAMSLQECQYETWETIGRGVARTYSCSMRVLAVTAMIGTCPSILPSLSRSRMRLVQAKPSMIGIYPSKLALCLSKDDQTYLKIHQNKRQIHSNAPLLAIVPDGSLC